MASRGEDDAASASVSDNDAQAAKALAAAEARAARPLRQRAPPPPPQPNYAPAAAAMPAKASASATAVRRASSSKRGGGGGGGRVGGGAAGRIAAAALAAANALEPALFASLQAAYNAIRDNDPHELQRIIRPNVVQHPKEQWLDLTPLQIAELGFMDFNFMTLTQRAFELEINQQNPPTSLLHMAARSERNTAHSFKSIPCMNVLLRNGMDVNISDQLNATALDESVKVRHLDGIHFLLFHGVDLNRVDYLGQTVLHSACRLGNLAVVKVLVEGNMVLNVQDKRGFTPLFWILDNNDKPAGLEIAIYLIEHGGDPTIRDKQGLSIITWCISTLLDFYGDYCNERDHFSANEAVETPYLEAASRLDLLEYLLTRDELPVDEKGSWRDSHTGEFKENRDALQYVLGYIDDDRKEQARLIAHDAIERKKDEKKKQQGEKKQAGTGAKSNKKNGKAAVAASDAAASEAASVADSAAAPTTVAAGDATINNDTCVDMLTPVAESTAAPADEVTEACGVNESAAGGVAASASSSSSSRAGKRAKREHETDAGSAAAAATASSASASASAEAADAGNNSNGGPYITSYEHFKPRLPVTDCPVCLQFYAGETIPEACARLVFMEFLRRATEKGDFGDHARVQELLALRKEHEFLNRRLVYHKHPAHPIRVGPAHVACTYVDEGCQDFAILRALLRAGIEDRTHDDKGFSALHVVSELGDIKAVKHLLNAGFDPNMAGARERDTSLMLCCDSQRHGKAVARALLDAGAQLYTLDAWQNTAFHWAVYRGNVGVLEELLKEHRSRSKFVSIKGTARTLGKRRAIALAGGGVGDDAEESGAGAIHLSAAAAVEAAHEKSGKLSSSDVALDPLTAANFWGNTVMHYACYKAFQSEGHIQCLRHLLAAADRNVTFLAPPNRSGLVPRQVVAGYNAPHLRGKRALLALNTGKFVEEPRGKEIARLEEQLEPVEAECAALLDKDRRAAEPGSGLTGVQRTAIQTELKRKQRQWRELDDQLKKMREESRALLEARLAKEDPAHLALAYTTPAKGKKSSRTSKAPAATAGAAAMDATESVAESVAEPNRDTAVHPGDSFAPASVSGADAEMTDVTSAAAVSPADASTSASAAAPSAHDGDAAPFAADPVPTPVPREPGFFQADISRGREWTPIPLVNDIDPPGECKGLDYKYITHCLPHDNISFPLPSVQSARWNIAGGKGEDASSSAAATGGSSKLSAQQRDEQRKFQQKQKARAAAKAAKARDGKAGRKPTGKSSQQQQQDALAASAAAAAASSSSSNSATGVLGVDSVDDDEGAGPFCECTGPGACMDGSCPCFRQFNEKHVGHLPRPEDISPLQRERDDPIAKMGRLAGKLEALCNCHELCRCRSDCANRHLARGIGVKLLVYKTAEKGWACRAAQFIRKGTFVVEYVGELVGAEEAARRLEDYDRRGIHYVFGFRHSSLCIDPVRMGNVARTINHSCNPNLTKIQVYHSDLRTGRRFPRMAFFAARDIEEGTELCISYDYETQEHPGGCLVCYCNEPNCRQTLV